jgi:hypothetical protein
MSKVSTPETTVTFLPARVLTTIVAGVRFPFLKKNASETPSSAFA